MTRYFLHTLLILLSLSLSACSNGFDHKKVEELLHHSSLSEDEYSELIELYEKGMDDAVKFSSKEPGKMTDSERQEVILLYEIGKRLAIDEENLNQRQLLEFERITQKGKEAHN